MSEQRAIDALEASGLEFEITRHGRVGSLAEAAAARGVEPRDIIKTLVVRRGDGDYLFVLVPGDREISWPKLRALLGVNRLSMPDKEVAQEVTGYERGTITPFGSTIAWPVIADIGLSGDPERRISRSRRPRRRGDGADRGRPRSPRRPQRRRHRAPAHLSPIDA